MTTLHAGWKLVPIEPTDEMETAAEDDYEQRGETFPDWKAKYRAMLAVAPTPPAGAQPERDWELTCDGCDGDGFVYVERRVGPCATDIQTFKEDCDCCEGRGFVFAFEDIPGIAEYVRKSHPAPASAHDDAQALLDHPLLREVLGYIEDAGPADVWGAAQSWMALRDAASQQQEG